MLKAPELLLPAGTVDKMRAAYDFAPMRCMPVSRAIRCVRVTTTSSSKN
jgi:hypothetical protein